MCVQQWLKLALHSGPFPSSPVFNCGSAGGWPLVLVKLRFTGLPFPSYIQGPDYLLPLNVAGAIGVRSSFLRDSLCSCMGENLCSLSFEMRLQVF